MAWEDKTPAIVTQVRLLNLPAATVYEELKQYASYQADSHFRPNGGCILYPAVSGDRTTSQAYAARPCRFGLERSDQGALLTHVESVKARTMASFVSPRLS